MSVDAFRDVMSALASAEAPPYGESVLTRMLKGSMGSNGHTVLCVMCAPGSNDYKETLDTLRYLRG